MKKDLHSQNGFAPIVLVFVVVILVVLSILIVDKFKGLIILGQKSVNIASNSSTIASSSAQVSLTPTKSGSGVSQSIPAAKTSSKTTAPAAKPSPVATTTPASTTVDNSCSYDLSGATGAVQVDIKPNHDQVVGDQIVELHAKSGCKILEGRSTDNWIMIARAGGNGYSAQNTVTYSTVPQGSYSVRIQYKGQWTDGKGVDVTSAKLSVAEFTVDGSAPPATPAPTPALKSTCEVYIASKTSDSAPATVNLVAGAHIYKPPNLADKYITAAQWDYNGDGSWDTDMSSSLPSVSKEFTQKGNFTIHARVQLSDEEVTDTCSNSFTLN